MEKYLYNLTLYFRNGLELSCICENCEFKRTIDGKYYEYNIERIKNNEYISFDIDELIAYKRVRFLNDKEIS